MAGGVAHALGLYTGPRTLDSGAEQSRLWPLIPGILFYMSHAGENLHGGVKTLFAC